VCEGRGAFYAKRFVPHGVVCRAGEFVVFHTFGLWPPRGGFVPIQPGRVGWVIGDSGQRDTGNQVFGLADGCECFSNHARVGIVCRDDAVQQLGRVVKFVSGVVE